MPSYFSLVNVQVAPVVQTGIAVSLFGDADVLNLAGTDQSIR
jgi:hypothetical protein